MQPLPTSLISTLEVFTQTILNVLSLFQLVGLLPYGIDGIHHLSRYHRRCEALDVIAHANGLSSGLWYGKGSLKVFFLDSQYSHTQNTASVIGLLLPSSRNFCPELLCTEHFWIQNRAVETTLTGSTHNVVSILKLYSICLLYILDNSNTPPQK